MKDELSRDQVEVVLRKINWAQNIIEMTQESNNEVRTADVLSSVSFILDSASQDAENLFKLLN